MKKREKKGKRGKEGKSPEHKVLYDYERKGPKTPSKRDDLWRCYYRVRICPDGFATNQTGLLMMMMVF